MQGFIPRHGQYRRLLSYRKAEVVYDITVRFCGRFLEKRDRTVDQMIQAARSGKQNIAEGSQASGTSTETEIKLTNVARASKNYGSISKTTFAFAICSNGRRTLPKQDLSAISAEHKMSRSKPIASSAKHGPRT